MSAAAVRRMLAAMQGAALALANAENIPGIPHHQWREIWRAKCAIGAAFDELQIAAVGPVAINANAEHAQ